MFLKLLQQNSLEFLFVAFLIILALTILLIFDNKRIKELKKDLTTQKKEANYWGKIARIKMSH